MGLVLGVIAGLAYGLSAFAGAFLALPLLVAGAGIGLHASLPVALLALGICAAVAAGDAVRARQCDVTLVGIFLVGAVPTALIAGWLAQQLPAKVLATFFLTAAIVFGPLLLNIVHRFRHRVAPSPAGLLHAPKRTLTEAAARADYRARARLRVALAGAGCGVLAAFCAAPGSRIGWRELERELPGQPYLVVGTLTFAVAVLAVLEAGLQFAVAPAAPGYTAGLFVLGAVAGMGLARRIVPRPANWMNNTVVGVAVIVGAIVLWVGVVTGWQLTQ
ncbi:TSUP family transporter [Salinisphaera aquimarina]|uniref:Probable membrane transporter protein n=1 Tax=Salinisphaera aquimarina TaxID=2094031 RepID=A0ABV7ET94_9GAMM